MVNKKLNCGRPDATRKFTYGCSLSGLTGFGAFAAHADLPSSAGYQSRAARATAAIFYAIYPQP